MGQQDERKKAEDLEIYIANRLSKSSRSGLTIPTRWVNVPGVDAFVNFISLVTVGSEHNTNLPWSARQRSGKHVVPLACPTPNGKVLNLCFSCFLSYDLLG